jgi:hypothetical protein
MSNNIIQSSAMPKQTITPLAPGATSPANSALITSQLQTQQHMALIGQGKSGGTKKYYKKYRGGSAPVVQVPPVSSGTVNPQQTASNYTGLTKLAQDQQTQAVFDNAKNPGDTAALQAQQEAIYKSGGSKKRTNKKGGSWPKWGCLSGGKKSKRRTNKNKKNKKSRKNSRRHH